MEKWREIPKEDERLQLAIRRLVNAEPLTLDNVVEHKAIADDLLEQWDRVFGKEH